MIADQVRPCQDATASRPSFCLALPESSPTADRSTLLARRQAACAQLRGGDAPGFCLVAPSDSATAGALERQTALALLRDRLGPGFHRTGTDGLELWVEAGVPNDVAEHVDGILREDAQAVQAYFDREFADAPTVFLFASQRSFGLALTQQFGYTAETATQLSNQYGGLLVGGIGAIAINGQNVLTDGRPVIFRHELTHVLAHELAGTGLPLWFDEGLAALVADPDATLLDPERTTALSVVSDATLRAIVFDEQRSWIERNTELGGHAYAVAAEAVRLIVERIGRDGLALMLEEVGRGAPLDRLYVAESGQSLSDVVGQLPDTLLAGCWRSVTVAIPRPDGLVLWRISGFGAERTVSVTVDGPNHYAFDVMTDRYGVYAGTLGTPMPSGTYVLRAAGRDGAVEISTVVGDPSSGAARACSG